MVLMSIGLSFRSGSVTPSRGVLYDHGYRPKWRYLVTMEYGPATLGPTFIFFFGISKPDYEKYLVMSGAV